jgi:long-chain acyl-CoA synthetase
VVVEQVEQMARVTEQLLQPGQPYEVVEEEVLGEKLPVFRNRPRSLREVLAAATSHGDRDCMVFSDGRRISHRQLERQVASVAAGLRDRYGIGPGDRVAICAANCPEWILTFWAVASLDAVVVAMNGWWTASELRNALDHTEPALLVVDEKRRQRLDDEPGVPTLLIERDFAALLGVEEVALPDVPIDEDDPVMLLFTSGTTGRPKAATLSHRGVIGYHLTGSFLAARGAALAGRPAAGGPPVTRLAVFPLFHVSGLMLMLGSVFGGGPTVWPLGRFDPARVIELTRRERIGAWTGTSTHMLRLLDHPDIETLDPLQIVQVGVGGSATTPGLVRRTEQRFPHLTGTFSSGYGSTESGGLVSWAPNWMLRAAPDCVGPPLPTIAVRITDDAGNEVPDGVEGNIEARSPIVMLGYWGHDEANAETFAPGRWLRIGDFGRLENGLLYLAARRRDLILRGGENIYPFEIENRLDEHPDVMDAAVFGVDHEILGQEVKAVVVVRADATVTAEELREFCRERLAAYKVPAQVELRTEALPRTATGKVMKHVLAGQESNMFVEE